MSKKYSLKFWIIFWVIACILLIAWFVFLQVKNRSVSFLNTVINVAPISQESQDDLHALVDIADYALQTQGQEKTFLILFQNNMEIRPGGGFIGSFGVLKIKDGHVIDFTSHDITNFEGRIPSTVVPPYPMKETLGINSWKLRDSNYSPDFSENVKQVESFYQMGGGQEQFDGVIAITANVLRSFLLMTGPVAVPGYPGEYTADNAVLGLEQQVEINFVNQNIDRGDRKSIMTPLAHEILQRVKDFSVSQKYELFNMMLENLRRKDVQLSFNDETVQQKVERAHWEGKVDTVWQGDYVMAVDANLNSWKSDYYVKRSLDYTVDFSGEKPHAKIAFTYNHTAKEKSWLTKDYQTYVRFYIPKGSWIGDISGNVDEPRYGDEFGKKSVGMLVHVPLGTSKTVTVEYDLPKTITSDLYDLKIQKQAGINDMPVAIHIIHANGQHEDRNIVLNQDFMW